MKKLHQHEIIAISIALVVAGLIAFWDDLFGSKGSELATNDTDFNDPLSEVEINNPIPELPVKPTPSDVLTTPVILPPPVILEDGEVSNGLPTIPPISSSGTPNGDQIILGPPIITDSTVPTSSSTSDGALIRGQVEILYFWANNCAPCLIQEPRIDELVQRYNGRVTKTKINTWSDDPRIDGYGVQGAPQTVMRFQGATIANFGGPKGVEYMADIIDEAFGY